MRNVYVRFGNVGGNRFAFGRAKRRITFEFGRDCFELVIRVFADYYNFAVYN